MESSTVITIGKLQINRVAQHVIFWTVIFWLFAGMYAVKSTFWVSFRNNLFYAPIHMTYFYVLAYFLLPKYLYRGKYVGFALRLLVLMFSVIICSRLVDIFIASPYIIQQFPNIEQEFVDSIYKRTFLQKITDEVLFINAFKMMHFVVWAALGIKLFRMWYERKQAALQAELRALKGQIHPHFLFNTLNNLYALTLTNSSKASQVVLGLSDMLRYMLYECNTPYVSLQKEVLMLQQYISLEKIRYEERIDLNFTVSGNLENKLTAPLIMLTFIENAFKHGASNTVGEAWVNIDLQVNNEQLKLKVANSKPETTPADADVHHGNIGLQNVRKRLELLYPSAYQLKIMDDEDTFLIVLELTIISQNQPVPNLTSA
ncbi:histidine kinase [Mucilaginibacter sp. PAMB04168]|uniref:sensor histidine kinase n=1 Tax=Mucilaginibacter sp. PAMB04168 TaxID=3138567 RepID=UPI0031F71F21